jgi:signal peptidase II
MREPRSGGPPPGDGAARVTPGTVRSMAARRRLPWLALGIPAAAALVADQATKAAVRSSVALGESVDTVGPFSIHHVRNSGILGGHLQGSALPIALATALALAALAVYALRREPGRVLTAVAFGLVLGGGLGNLVDRLRLGYVTDFIDRGSGGAFNFADVAIMLGLVGLLFAKLTERGARDRASDPVTGHGPGD